MLAAKFTPSQVVITPGAALAIEESGLDPAFFLQKHLCGDWGDLDETDRVRNRESLQSGGRVVSRYKTLLGKRLGVITPPDRSVTIILEFPEEC
jgi:hypothetical protein